ncbi:fimbrial protein [Bordetella holmesii]|uniref:Fimbrial protein n=2 Tax=Bordetella holmesii TaxID=35814 RepID=A0A158M4J9_9BORD|nr:fimbrial protein [Bordetella holmesii]AGV05228.1 FimA [Bordetella holmesii]AWP67259.1 fimbrial protein [Bordetella holmesii]AWP93351.1 fimbrial protein [Bordetella holmesii]KAK79168.1 fimbrial protein [Bordetella holmesii H620]KAK82552.1 fimbrial protein [Bordetella holmesii CDC-H809-BH]
MSAGALASDGTITIRGEIIDTTCKIEDAEPPADIAVRLPKISTAAIRHVNDTAGATVFTIRLSECPAAINGQNVHIYFEPGHTTDYDSHTLIPYQLATAATPIPQAGVGATRLDHLRIELAGLDGVQIPMGSTPDMQKAIAGNTFRVTDNKADARFIARYKRISDGAIAASHVGTTVQFSVMYP